MQTCSTFRVIFMTTSVQQSCKAETSIRQTSTWTSAVHQTISCNATVSDSVNASQETTSLTTHDEIQCTASQSTVQRADCTEKTRNSSGDEIANVNLLYDDIVHALKYNRLLHKFRHRSFSATQVYQIQWNYAMLWPLRRSRSFKVTDFGTNRKLIYDFLLVINTNLLPILHRFQVMADYWSNFP